MTGRATGIGAALLAILPLAAPAAAAPAHAARPAPVCDAAARARLLSPPAEGDETVRLTCSATLAPGDEVRRRVLLEGAASSGVTLDCAGAIVGTPARPALRDLAVEVRSRPLPPGPDGAARWEPVTDVAIRRCTILGHVRIWGMGLNGQGEAVRDSSHALGHTERAQAAAPTRIRIEDSRLVATGFIPLYVAPGVTAVSLRHSTVSGTSSSVALYLDAESAGNVVEDNVFDIRTGRELVAVDGSAGNRIAGNTFVLRNRGGIYLYRNCGEGGTVRHQTPSDNVVTGNVFRHEGLLRRTPVIVGSRGGFGLHCAEDDGYPFGSSADDGDHAERNVVEGNREE